MLATAVVATLNEERHIERCLRQLLDQRALDGDLEILVIDGGSRDRTADIVCSFREFGSRIQLLSNPKRYQAYAYNQGIRVSSAQYVWFVVAHAEYADDYLAEAIALIRRLDAANVGGVPKAVGDSPIGKAIAFAMSSPFGVGDATFRYVEDERCADSVFVGVARRDRLLEIGGFNEDVPIGEDVDLNLRIRMAGYRLATGPKLRCRYHMRRNLGAFAKQMYRYGFWKRKAQLHFGAKVPPRVLAPPALVVALALSPLLPSPLSWFAAGAYALFLCAATTAAIPRLRALSLLVPVTLATMHVSYGVGWLAGLVTHKRSHPRDARSGALTSG
jgi:succinoglycan biosynthesis protein ExoA